MHNIIIEIFLSSVFLGLFVSSPVIVFANITLPIVPNTTNKAPKIVSNISLVVIS
jgi:hypothetical protein